MLLIASLRMYSMFRRRCQPLQTVISLLRSTPLQDRRTLAVYSNMFSIIINGKMPQNGTELST